MVNVSGDSDRMVSRGGGPESKSAAWLVCTILSGLVHHDTLGGMVGVQVPVMKEW